MKKIITFLTLFMLVAFSANAAELFKRYQATGAGAIDEAITFGNSNVYVTSVTLILDGACATSENLVVRNSAAGALYYNADFDTETSYVWNTKTPISGRNSETLDVEFTNTDANNWVLTVYYEVR